MLPLTDFMAGRQKIENFIYRRPLLAAGIIGFVLLGLAMLSPVQTITTVPAPADDRAILFGDTRSVGQSFFAPYGLNKVVVPIEVNTEAIGPLILHIRRDYFSDDIRTSVIFAPESGSVEFSFHPLTQPKEKLVWVLEAPHSPDQSYSIPRELDQASFPQGAFMKGKAIDGHFGFSYGTKKPQGVIWANTVIQEYSKLKNLSLTGFSSAGAILAGIYTAAALVFILFYLKPKTADRRGSQIVAIIIFSSLALHLYLAGHIPAVNDEGAYVQDAMQTGVHFFPIKHFLTKGIAFIFLLKAYLAVVPNNVIAWRTMAVVASGISVWLLYLLAGLLKMDSKARVVAAAILGLSPAAIFLTTPLLLQSVSSVMVLAGFVAVLIGSKQINWRWVALGAFLMTAAYLTRASSVVGAVLGLVLIAMYARPWKRLALIYTGVGLGLGLVIFVSAWLFMGRDKAAVLFNLEALVISQQHQQSVAALQEPVIRQFLLNTSLLWQGAPWLAGGILFLPVLLLARRPLWQMAAGLLGWGWVMFEILWQLNDMEFFLPGGYSILRYWIIAIVAILPIVAAVIFVSGSRRPMVMAQKWLVFSCLWLLLLAILYWRWGKFRSNYLVEFIAPLALIGGWVYSQFIQVMRKDLNLPKKMAGAVCAAAAIFAMTVNWQYLYEHPFTGSMDQQSLKKMVHLIRQNAAAGEEIFTAQPTLTALAERPIIFGYSHPGWYREEYFGNVSPQLRSLYFIEPDTLTEYLAQAAEYVLTDVRTNEIYFDLYPERQQLLRENFTPVGQVANEFTDESFVLYKRK